MLDKAKQLQWLHGFDVGNMITTNITHLLYADDTEANTSQVLYLNLALLIFEALAGLHINMLKRMIYPVNEVLNLEELAGILGCSVGESLTSYLGLPLGAKYKSSTIWRRVIEKFEKKLASWKMQYLSMGGRLTIIISVVVVFPLDICNVFLFLEKCWNNLTRSGEIFYGKGILRSTRIILCNNQKSFLPQLQGG